MAEKVMQTEVIQNFLRNLEVNFASDLTDRYNFEMEVQVNVDPTLGELVHNDSHSSVWERNDSYYGVFRYWHVRIPKNAKGHVTQRYPDGQPYYEDRPLAYPLHLVAQDIGMTGWNWVKKRSLWVGFDFDSISGHAPGVGLTDDELDRIRESAIAIPWVQVRRSTGGRGLHLYAYFDPDNAPECENHTLHSAAARALLGLMSREVGFDFQPNVDCYGGNIWVWSRRINADNHGLELIKNHEDYAPALPPNWRDNADVVAGRRTKIRINGVGNQDVFDAQTASMKKTPLSEKHLEVEHRISELGYTIVWTPDHHCWATHTKAFQDLIEENPEDYLGVYETISEGNDPGKPNCFVFPLPDDGFRIVRFNQGARETEMWVQDGRDWTWCYFNKQPTLRATAAKLGGIEDPDNGGWVFNDLASVTKVIEILGGKIAIDHGWASVAGLDGRTFKLRESKNGDVVIEMSASKNETKPPQGWIKKPGRFIKKLPLTAGSQMLKTDELQDDTVRALVGPGGDLAGWVVYDTRGEWVGVDKYSVKNVLKAKDIQDPDRVIGELALNSWKLVNIPFQPEYPGNREWNREAAQFKFPPGDPGAHPHWDMILSHCGNDLTEAIKEHPWCEKHGITNGQEYLMAWVACLFRHPYDALPYLFFYGPQNSGKSIFHEAISLLMTKGVVYADEALKNQQGFNGELANAILCVVEETDLSQVKHAYNRLKAWVTGLMIRLRPMYQPVYMQRNTTHWVHCANSLHEVPLFPGDTRIVMSWVPQPEVEIPKDQLKQRLLEEAPSFLRSLLDTRIPAPPGRLRLPVIETDTKKETEAENRSALERFIDGYVYHVPGAATPYGDFYDAFMKTLSKDQRKIWTRFKVSSEIREKNLLTLGRIGANTVMVANILLEPAEHGKFYGPPWINVSGSKKLRRKE